ncbi:MULTISPECIES: serine/threonine-protein kinase [unclassified Serratia (in: enterobacteria)]|uniref:serine/threonine protein kinase n=1 Tax=unclassified Serratia (in: enterobacteria) TaxID=2647522 RepID=UPI000502987C|nr:MULTISPECIES: serine/threonine-protein kinase [unclassified Serratia (in: enterobacteria)]KFK97896.1 nuclease PIN [Serratia sp. Ag2]KFL00287.1 nuclease PIN [Serratia sp. Ag1]
MSGNGMIKPNSNSLPIGYRFNEFEIKEVIGEGGFGIVYRAYDHQLERIIAIKEYIPSSLVIRNEDLTLSLRGERFSRTFQVGLNSFIQEARLLARFSHPALLNVMRFWEENGTAYMGMQFYTGTTLKKFRVQHPEKINEAWIRNMLPTLLSAINTIHQEGYLHRDISLDNIQIQENQLPVLLDFGSARKEIGNLSDETEIMLKPGFAPIEQYTENSDGEQGPWTDIYAFGAVLHTLIMGTPPPVSVVRSIEDSYQPLTERRPKGYSLDLLDAIDRALALKPEDRPQTIGEMAELLHLSIASEHEIAGAQPAANSLIPVVMPQVVNETRDIKRLRPFIFGAGMAAVLIAGLIIWFNSGSSSVITPIANNTLTTQAPEPQSVATTPAPAAPATPALTSVAVVYFKLQSGEELRINGEKQHVTPDQNGFVHLNLATGQYLAEVLTAKNQYQKKFTVEQAGTWLINP